MRKLVLVLAFGSLLIGDQVLADRPLVASVQRAESPSFVGLAQDEIVVQFRAPRKSIRPQRLARRRRFEWVTRGVIL